MAEFLRAEIYTDVIATGFATRKYAVPPKYLVSLVTTLAIDTPESGRLVVSAEWDFADSLLPGWVVRIQSTDATDFEEWRIGDIEDGSGPDAPTVTYALLPISADVNRGIYTAFDALGVPSQKYIAVAATADQVIDDALLPALADAGVAHIAKGTIDPTQTFDIDFDEANGAGIIAAIQQDGGAPSEFQLRRNGTTNYLVDLLDEIGSSAPIVDVATRKNLNRLKRVQRGSQMVNRYRARAKDDGTHRGLGYAYWLISAIGANDHIDVTDPRGGSYPGPVRFSGQLSGFVNQIGVSRTLVAIDAAVRLNATTARISVSDTSSFAVGRYVEFFRTSSGLTSERLWYLDNPDAQSLLGGQVYENTLVREGRSGAVNFVFGNPAAAIWSNHSNPPDGWSKTGTGTFSYDATVTQFGGASYKWVTGATNPGVIRSETIKIPEDTSNLPYRFWVWLFVDVLGNDGNAVKVQLVRADTHAAIGPAAIFLTADMVSSWVRVELESYNVGAAGGGCQIEINNNGSWPSSTIHVDAFGCQPLAWAQHDTYTPDACDLWHDTNDALERDAFPVGYELEAADLEQVAGMTLVEAAATNLALRSDEFDNAAIWVPGHSGSASDPTVTADQGTAPDGTVTADKVAFTATGSDNSHLEQAGIAVTNGLVYATSFWVKAFAAGDIGKIIGFRGPAANAYTLVALTASWQRVQSAEVAAVGSCSVALRPAVGTSSGTVTILIWRGQLELGQTATSPIHTTSVAVTRAADYATNLQFAKGGTCRIYDQDLGLQVSLRLMEFTRDRVTPGDVQLRFGVREKTLGQVLKVAAPPPPDSTAEIIRKTATAISDAIDAGAVQARDGILNAPVLDSSGAPTGDTVTIDGDLFAGVVADTLRKSFV